MRPSRWPVRARLTALYAAAFVAAGVVLVAATYWLVARSLHHGDHAASAPRHPGYTDEMAQTTQDAIDAYRAETLSDLLTWSVMALAGSLVVAVALGWILAGRALRPLHQITETATRIADRSLHERIALTGPDDEVKELADTIDEMLERLDRSFDAQRRFVANASHELRTPLAVNRTMLEVAADDRHVSDDLRLLAPKLLATNERSEQLVEGLLILARSEQEIGEQAAVDLAEVVSTAIEQLHHEAVQHRMTVTTDLQPAQITGNPALVERLAANLVQNAVRHSPPSSETVVRTGRQSGHSVLQVENPGAVLRPGEIDELFEPFHRGNGRTSSGGAGLGLSIVRSVARAHRGQVSAHPRRGGGLVVRVELPARHADVGSGSNGLWGASTQTPQALATESTGEAAEAEP